MISFPTYNHYIQSREWLLFYITETLKYVFFLIVILGLGPEFIRSVKASIAKPITQSGFFCTALQMFTLLEEDTQINLLHASVYVSLFLGTLT